MKEALLSIIKDENRIITGQIDPQYLSDNLGRKKGTAEAVVFPVSTEEISGVMRYAWKNNLPVTPRGCRYESCWLHCTVRSRDCAGCVFDESYP